MLYPKQEYRKNLKLALPVIISQGGQMVVGIVDNLMIGNYDTTLLAASAFANSIFSVVLVLGIGFSHGITPLVGKAYGAGDNRKAAELLRASLGINIVTCSISALLLVIGSGLLYQFGQEDAVAENAIPYFKYLAYSLPPLLCYFSFKQFAEGLEQTRQIMVFTLLGNALNILLNYLLIFGNWGFPEWGLVGAGVATWISRTIMPIGLGIYIFINKTFKPYIGKRSDPWLLPKLYMPILKLGIPIGIQFMLEVSAFNFGSIMVGWIGATALAAHQIALSVVSLAFMMITGVSSAATIRVSNQLGAKNYKYLPTVAYSNVHISLVIMGFMAIALVFGGNWIAEMHTDDVEVIQFATSMMLIAAMFELFDGAQTVFIGALRGMEDVRFPSYVSLLSYWLVSIPIGYYLMFHLDFSGNGMWIGFLAGLVLASILLGARLQKNLRRLQDK